MPTVLSVKPSERPASPTNMILSYLGLPFYLVAVGIAFWTPVATLVICGALWVVWAIRAPEPAGMGRGDTSPLASGGAGVRSELTSRRPHAPDAG